MRNRIFYFIAFSWFPGGLVPSSYSSLWAHFSFICPKKSYHCYDRNLMIRLWPHISHRTSGSMIFKSLKTWVKRYLVIEIELIIFTHGRGYALREKKCSVVIFFSFTKNLNNIWAHLDTFGPFQPKINLLPHKGSKWSKTSRLTILDPFVPPWTTLECWQACHVWPFLFVLLVRFFGTPST